MSQKTIIKIAIFSAIFLIASLIAVNFALADNCPLNTEVGETQATLVGEITDDGGDPNLEVWFDYGKSMGYAYQTAHFSKYGTGLFCSTVYNLEPCTTYYYRAVAKNSSGISYGENKTFTAKCAPVSIDIKANGSNGPITLNYQESVNLSWTSQNAVSCEASGDWSGSKTTSGSQTIQLNSVKTYNFTIVCKNAGQTQMSTDSVQVIVNAKPPTVITKPAIVTY